MASKNTDKNTDKRPKLVRDSFTIPKAEFASIDLLKTRAMALGTSVKKSELLRAGLMVLKGLNDAAYKSAIAAVPTLKTGRPSTESPVQKSTRAVAKPQASTAPKALKPAAKPAVKKAVKRSPEPAPKVAVRATPTQGVKTTAAPTKAPTKPKARVAAAHRAAKPAVKADAPAAPAAEKALATVK